MWELWPVVNWMSIMCTINIRLQHSFSFSPCACTGLGHILQNMWYIWWKRDVFCGEVRIELKGLELSFCPPPWTLDHRWPLSFKISKTIETNSWALKKNSTVMVQRCKNHWKTIRFTKGFSSPRQATYFHSTQYRPGMCYIFLDFFL